MFDLTVIIRHKDASQRMWRRHELEDMLRSIFPEAIRDVSVWKRGDHESENEDRVSIQFEHSQPQEIRKWACGLGYEVQSLQNMLTGSYFPTNRQDKRRKKRHAR